MGNTHSHINLPHANIRPIHILPLPPLPKPQINMDILQKATGIIAGLVALSPIGRLAELAVFTVADTASHGKASEFINNGHTVNTTLNLLPGGMLAQQVANDLTNGLVGSTLQKFVPDPKKMVIHDVVKIGETIVLHPSQTLNVGKDLGNSNYHELHDIVDNYGNVVKKEKPTINHIMSAMIDNIKIIVQVPHKDENPLHIKHLIETTLPKKVTHLPKIETTLPKIETTLPKIETTLPKEVTHLPKIHTTLPPIHTTLPPIHTILPPIHTTLPLWTWPG